MSDGLLRFVPLGLAGIALVWAIVRLAAKSFAADEAKVLRESIDSDLAQMKDEFFSALNGQGRRIDAAKSQIDLLQGRIEGQDAALSRHARANAEGPISGIFEHLKDLSDDLAASAAKIGGAKP
jgi:hypothetical protein